MARSPNTTSKLRELIPRRQAAIRRASNFSGLHFMAAGLYLATGMRPRHPLTSDRPSGRARTLRRLPLALAPLAGAAHITRALQPTPAARVTSRVLNGLTIGIAVAEVGAAAVQSLRPDGLDAPWHGRGRLMRGTWSNLTAPIAFGATGLLGLLLEHEEDRDAERRAQPERQPGLVDRIFARQRPRVDRVIVHV